MIDYDAAWVPADPYDPSPFASSVPGWSNGCRDEDTAWIDTFGYLDFPHSISNPTDALPGGYEAYTAVLHGLEDRDSERRIEWVSDPRRDPWQQVQHIVDHGLGSWRLAADNDMGQPEGSILADVLGLADFDYLLSVSYFFPAWAGTVRSRLLAERLRVINHSSGFCPTFWFPHTRDWAASTPHDAGWTYVASSREIARRLHRNPAIETLECNYQSAK